MHVLLLIELLSLVLHTSACGCTQHSFDNALASNGGYMKLQLYSKHTQQPIQDRRGDVPSDHEGSRQALLH